MKITIKKLVVHNHAPKPNLEPNIYINIGKLQDKTEINVSELDEGLSELEEKVKEILLRSINSARNSLKYNPDKPPQPFSENQN